VRREAPDVEEPILLPELGPQRGDARARTGSCGNEMTVIRSGSTPRSSTIRRCDSSETVSTRAERRATARKNARLARREARVPPWRSGIVSWISVSARPPRSGRI
jgi:hypothetical protein